LTGVTEDFSGSVAGHAPSGGTVGTPRALVREVGGTLSLHPYRNDVGQCTLQVFDSRGGFLSSKSNRTPIFCRNRNSVSVRIVRDGGSPPATRAGGVGDRAVCSTGS
jgi:hypothetical protein